jgi:hypothetical protein
MKTLVQHLNELDELVRKIRHLEMKLEEFETGVCRIMGDVWGLSGTKQTATKFQDADFTLTRLVKESQEKPDPAGISRIKNAIVAYKREATL